MDWRVENRKEAHMKKLIALLKGLGITLGAKRTTSKGSAVPLQFKAEVFDDLLKLVGTVVDVDGITWEVIHQSKGGLYNNQYGQPVPRARDTFSLVSRVSHSVDELADILAE